MNGPRSRRQAPAQRQPARAAAARAVAGVLGGRSLTAVLPLALAALPPEDQSLAQKLVYGTLRWEPRLRALLLQLIDKPLRRRDAEIEALALVGLFQLLYTRTPAYAAVSATVDAARALGGRRWAGGFLNALLRRFQREQETLLHHVQSAPEARYAHPPWMVEAIRGDWPEHWEQVLDANNASPPMTLRVALDRIPRSEWLQQLAETGIAAAPHPQVASAVTLHEPQPVNRLPGFEAGLVSVQDGGAQLAAQLLAPQAGQRVLDACAAPGGKTIHLLEWQPELAELVAVDQDAHRLERLRQNLARSHRQAKVLCADMLDSDLWWDGRRFDRILLDAPCSASGVVRRHPDIKQLRRAADLHGLQSRQRKLLQAAWRQLAPGGILLYVTCSIFRAENELVVSRFLDHHPDASVEPLVTEWGQPAGPGRQILPGDHGMDGFFYARLRRQATC